MKKNDFLPNCVQLAGACAIAIGIVALAGDSNAATAAGMANAAVVEVVSVSVSAPPISMPALSGTILSLSSTLFSLESFAASLSPSGPLLRFGSPPIAFGAVSGREGVAGAAPAAAGANSATVHVIRNADGSLKVSADSGSTFAVSRPGASVVYIEYN